MLKIECFCCEKKRGQPVELGGEGDIPNVLVLSNDWDVKSCIQLYGAVWCKITGIYGYISKPYHNTHTYICCASVCLTQCMH